MKESVPLKDRLLSLLQSPEYTPQDGSGLARMLGISSTERPALRQLIRNLVSDGVLLQQKQKRFVLKAEEAKPLRGRIRSGLKGKLYFCPNSEGQERLLREWGDAIDTTEPIEIPITPNRALDALPGDTVLAVIRTSKASHHRCNKKHHHPPRGHHPQAHVWEIVERKLKRWVGIYHPGGLYGYVQGDGYAIPKKILLSEPPPDELLPGMSVVVHPERYPLGNMDATGHITDVLGWPGDIGTAITSIMHRYALRDTFPAAVLNEMQCISQEIPAEEISRREDWRNRCVITIDPIDARDFDDAISVQRKGEGWELAVHIADVSHYVCPGSATDIEAQARGNSTYLPDRVLPMLPPMLCDNICSLREGEDRLTCLCKLRIDADGNTQKAVFRKAVMRSRKRFAYEEVLPIITGTTRYADDEINTMLHEAHALAQALRRRRMQKEALNLDMPELHILVNDKGEPTDVQQNAGDIAHQLIEECMLAANEAVASALNAAQLPAIHRVHEPPTPAKLSALEHELRSYGIHIGLLNSRTELCKVSQSIIGHQDELALKALILRSMMRARYDAKSLGHFGLNKGNYCHFTSPIRRYADLLVHRAFSRLIPQTKTTALPTGNTLSHLADHLSETERNSAYAESAAQQAMLLRYMQLQSDCDSPRIWQARITETWMQGMAVDIPELRLHGFIPGEALEESGRWFYESHARRWSCTDGRELRAGDTVDVIPSRVDIQEQFIEFAPAVVRKA